MQQYPAVNYAICTQVQDLLDGALRNSVLLMCSWSSDKWRRYQLAHILGYRDRQDSYVHTNASVKIYGMNVPSFGSINFCIMKMYAPKECILTNLNMFS